MNVQLNKKPNNLEELITEYNKVKVSIFDILTFQYVWRYKIYIEFGVKT